MTTLYTYRLLAGFGDATSADVGDYVEFAILWDGNVAEMPGWDQANKSATTPIPGGNRNIVFLMGLGPITRTFTIECKSKQDFNYLARLQQSEGTLRVPAAMNELDVATEVDYSGSLVADIPRVVMLEFPTTAVYVDGCVRVGASFWRDGRE